MGHFPISGLKPGEAAVLSPMKSGETDELPAAFSAPLRQALISNPIQKERAQDATEISLVLQSVASPLRPGRPDLRWDPATARDWFVCLLCRPLATRVTPRSAQSVHAGFPTAPR